MRQLDVVVRTCPGLAVSVVAGLLLASACDRSVGSSADGAVPDGTTGVDGSVDGGRDAGPPPVCGNGILEVGEACEGDDLYGQTCATAGFASGRLACASCGLDTTACGCEVCDNLQDDDGDGLVDCDDPDCLGLAGCPTEQCSDGVDNDGNGYSDCEDPGCASNAPGCNGGCFHTETDRPGLCGNGADDDCDGLDDADDPDCVGQGALLLVQATQCGQTAPGDPLRYTVLVHADADDLTDVTVTLVLDPARLDDIVPEDGGILEATTQTVTWTLGNLPLGTGVAVHVQASIRADATTATPICEQATVATPDGPATPTDDPLTVTPTDPTCVQVGP
jgi:hypothetical protein